MNSIPDTDDYYAFDEWQDLCELARCDDDPQEQAENFHHDLEETKSKDNSTSTEHEHNEQ